MSGGQRVWEFSVFVFISYLFFGFLVSTVFWQVIPRRELVFKGVRVRTICVLHGFCKLVSRDFREKLVR